MDQRQLTSLTGRLPELSETNKQLVKFGFIGGLAVLTDLSFYYVFLHVFHEGPYFGWVENEAISKSLSFLCGLMVTYQFNKRWTWRRKDRSNRRLVKFLGLYGISLMLNVGLNTLFLEVLHTKGTFSGLPFKYFFAFIGATGVCAAFTFIGQKFWIFKESGVVNG